MNNQPVIGVLLGDPTGIGPEIVAKLLAQPEVSKGVPVVVIGDQRLFKMGQEVAGVDLPFPVIQSIDEASFEEATPVVLDYPTLAPEEVTYKRVSAKAGKSVYETLLFALDLAQAEKINGIVFGPFHKEAMGLGGCPFHSEFELFKDKFDRPNVYGEINILDELWTTRVTSHIALKEVSALITQERVYRTIGVLNAELQAFGLEKPHLAVTALNPHAGEGGMFGREEIDVITPAIEQAREAGIYVDGPFPADTIFRRVEKDNFNGIISMYHDQGQVATKLLGFERGVTLHGGMPIPITTPAHGTAYGRAGENRASAEAMIRAFEIGCTLAKNKLKAA
ncbi:4-hydroxythreonine-4-phosphate dehydrogenase PdxA [candidate division KSB3 bacterium]|uniref:4-hydroxythreonine-4-phosphate dehydrogenase PdxA n=1 Tax=candidate division KSB3 bacterium TaxID=2044937 RepID=A0A9D5Q5C0_9BACT|nr:4-hydroxythreonine-4-phosphate dehydrogenase PdxA [candidate division KSB3 bacterium]MBD3324163.1 4-hydroxythreonine-4-phosphate dehydrogenase PdxA [candidate division KSB3 bacterium]